MFLHNAKRSFLASVISIAVFLYPREATPSTYPEPPRHFFDTAMTPQHGRVSLVKAGGDFQAALNQAVPGDVILLEAGATFTGTFVLPVKSGEGWIVVATSAFDRGLPRPGHRINSSFAGLLPKLVAPALQPAIRAAPRAHHFRFVGIEIRPEPGAFTFNLVELGSTETSETDLPHHLIFDRCYIHGDPLRGSRRGIAMNAAWVAVIDSYLADFKETPSDSQAIAAWNGPGPFKIVNNYLEGSGENIMFGGADPRIQDLVPSDIEIRHNHFFKPLTWRISDPAYAGTPWAVKNLFELKNARRVLVVGNIFENNWLHAQNGFAILLTPRNQDGTAPWSVVEDVTFRDNIVRHSGSAMNITGRDDIHPSQQTKRILVANNLFLDIGPLWGGAGRLFQLLNGTADTVIDHNTAFHTGDVVTGDAAAHFGFVFRNNLTPHNQYGVGGTGTYGNPLLTLATYFPGALFVRNVLAGGNPLSYPPDNLFPPTLAEVGFMDFLGGDYRLSPNSPYKNAGTDAKDIGVDVDAVRRATNGVEAGVNNEPPRCDAARAEPSVLWPPNHQFVLVRILGLTDADNDPLSITITEVTQNEPVNGPGDGDTTPDVIIQGDVVLLRAERSCASAGRIYRIRFIADDGFGETCQGTVTVTVPCNQRRAAVRRLRDDRHGRESLTTIVGVRDGVRARFLQADHDRESWRREW